MSRLHLQRHPSDASVESVAFGILVREEPEDEEEEEDDGKETDDDNDDGYSE